MSWRSIARWIAPLLIALGCFLPSLHAQTEQGNQGAGDEGSSRTAALPYAVAFLSLLLIMVIICKPSRKPEPKR